MKVLVTGGREWNNLNIIRRVLEEFPTGTVLIHGGQKTQRFNKVQKGRRIVSEPYYIGADYQCAQVADELNFFPAEFKADWDGMAKLHMPRGFAGPFRNQVMVNQKPDTVRAFHFDWRKSRGTLDTIGRALLDGIEVVVTDEQGHQEKPTLEEVRAAGWTGERIDVEAFLSEVRR
jgi:hypothetical protein